MGTLGFYVILGVLYLFGYKEKFLKKSLDYKISVFGSVHDAITSIWWIVIMLCIGVGLQPNKEGMLYISAILFMVYLPITIYEYRKERIYFVRKSDEDLYDIYMQNEKVIKRIEDGKTRTEDNNN